MRLAIFLTLLLAVTRADECTEEELDTLFFYLTPVISVNANSLLDFTTTNSAVCLEAKNLMTLQGDFYSDNFLDKFCECAMHTGYDVLNINNINCDVNGLPVADLKDACGERYCATAESDAEVRKKCFCEGSWLVSTVPPDVGSTGQNQAITNYCSEMFKNFRGFTEKQECACFTGYYPLDEVNEYIGCKFAKSLNPLSPWAHSVSFAEYAAGCKLESTCRDCTHDESSYYNLLTGACTKLPVADGLVLNVHYVVDDEECWDQVLPNALSRRVGFSAQDDTLNPSKYLPDCEQCTGNLHVYYTPEDGDAMCLTACPSQADLNAKRCILAGATCPTPCPAGTCGNGDCFSDGDCICGTNGFGPNCETARHEVSIAYTGSLLSTELFMDASFMIKGVAQTARNKDGFPFVFNFPQDTSYSLDPYGTTNSVCYFQQGNRKLKVLEGSMSSAVSDVSVECVDGETLLLNIGGLTVSGDELTALYPYVNTEFVTAMQQAIQAIHPGTNVANYHINLESGNILENTEGIRFAYTVEVGEVTSQMRDTDNFATTVENCMRKQPYLAQFWATSTMYVTFEMVGVDTMCISCLTEVVAVATGFEVGSVSIITTPMTGVTGGYIVNVLFKGSDAQITTLSGQVQDGSFKTNVERELTNSNSFTVNVITLTNKLDISFTMSNVDVVSTNELKQNFATTLPYEETAVSVNCNTASVLGYHSCVVTLTGSIDSLTEAEKKIGTSDFQSSWNTYILTRTSMAGAATQWSLSSGDMSWQYTFRLTGVNVMDTVELINLISSTVGLGSDHIAITTSRTGTNEYQVTTTFTGTITEITSVQNQIISGAWGTNFQHALTSSTVFAGTVLGDAGETSTLTWYFELGGLSGLDQVALDELTAIVARAFGVDQFVGFTSLTASVTAADSNRYGIYVTFSGSTTNVQVVTLALTTFSYVVPLETGITGSSVFGGGVSVHYSDSEQLSWIVVVSDQPTMYMADFISTLSSYYAFSTSGISVQSTTVGTDSYSMEITFTGTEDKLVSVQEKLSSDSTLSSFQEVLRGGDRFTTATTTFGEFDPYLDCMGFLFFYEGACDTTRDLDIFFLIDSSSTMEGYFEAVQQWLEVVMTYSMPDGTNPGLLQYATVCTMKWELDTYTLPADVDQVVAEIRAMAQIGGMTATSLAVEEGLRVLKLGTAANKILVLVTDGAPTETYEPCNYADELRANNITTIVIGVGEWDKTEVSCVAFNPDSEADDNPYIITIVNFETFDDILTDFNSVVCPGAQGSPFDGYYVQTDLRWNDRFVYSSGKFDMLYNGVEWSITDATEGSFVSVDGGNNQVVDSIKTWNHFNPDGSFNSAWTQMLTSCDQGTTLQPTNFPTIKGTDEPSKQPHIDPTRNPTTMEPSKAPTELNCEHLRVYRSGSCEVGLAVDIIFVVDSSTSISDDDYELMKDWLEHVYTNATSRSSGGDINTALLQFSGPDGLGSLGYQIEWRLSDNLSVEQTLTKIRGLQHMKGSTHTKTALEVAIDQLLPESGSSTGKSSAVTVLITDGRPTVSAGQAPCTDDYDAGQVLADNHSLGVVIGIGEELNPNDPADAATIEEIQCVATSEVQNEGYVYFVDSIANVNLVVGNLDGVLCNEPTPFDGRYRIAPLTGSEITAGGFTFDYKFESYEDWQLSFTGSFWAFQDPVLGSMTSLVLDPSQIPVDFGAWRYVSAAGEPKEFDRVRVVCAEFDTPTGTPTNPPSESPTDRPTVTPTDPPSTPPSPQPTQAPSGDTKSPTHSTPSRSPTKVPSADCKTVEVYQGLCQNDFGVDFVWNVHSAENIGVGTYTNIVKLYEKITANNTIVPDPATNPAGGVSVGGVLYSGACHTKIDFFNGNWNAKDAWLEYVRNFEQIDDAPTVGADIVCGINRAIYDMFPLVYSALGTEVLVSVVVGTPDQTVNCNDVREQLHARGIIHIVIGVGTANLDWDYARCLATDASYFLRRDSTNVENTDIYGLLCDTECPYAGAYNRLGTEPEDLYPIPCSLPGANANTCGTASFQYFRTDNVNLKYEGEFWQISGATGTYVARSGAPGFPPDMENWDWFQAAKAVKSCFHVRIVCAQTCAPTRDPTDNPTIVPTVMPTKAPTVVPTVMPTVTPTPPPTDSPFPQPTSLPTTNPTPSPTDMPTVLPTVVPTVPPTRMPTREPTVMPTVTPTKEPSPYPTVVPTYMPSDPPTTSVPSTTPTIAPTDDCHSFIVGDCYCPPESKTHILWCNVTHPWRQTVYNGRYSRTRIVREGKPVYRHKENWIIFWDEEVWVFDDPLRIRGIMAELIGGIHIYPDNWVNWVYLSRDSVSTKITNLTICCTNTTAPTRTPSYIPTTTPSNPPSGTPTTGTPTGTPSSNPTPSPTPSPTLPPTVVPSVVPSLMPTRTPSAPPTQTPSLPPTKSPSVMPTKTPTLPPTKSPSVMPTQTPTPPPTKTPTVDPTPFPTPSPTPSPTDKPTKSPTPSPTPPPVVTPTNFPTQTPTQPPTDDCPHFIVGYCPCLNGTELDLVLLLDASNSMARDETCSSLGADVNKDVFCGTVNWLIQRLEFFPEGARVGIAQYGTEFAVELTLTDNQDFADIAQNTLTNIKPLGGATFTKFALEQTLTEVWDDSVLEQRRERVTVLITDAQPTTSQNPCGDNNDPDAIRNAYDAKGIEIFPVAVDETGDGFDGWSRSISCLAGGRIGYKYFNVQLFEFESIIESVWNELNLCVNYTTSDTPYNGGYSRTNIIKQGKPVYRHCMNWVAEWSGEVWVFSDPNSEIGIMSEIVGGNQIYPQNKKDWTVERVFGSGLYTDLSKVLICCVKTATPTKYPSEYPTVVPSLPPTKNPTVVPTRVPTVDPTVEPTVMPTVMPTRIPSRVPTIDPTLPPTVTPTTYPTDYPSPLPSVVPTQDPTLPPTIIPTDTPSHPPSTAYPSPPPTLTPTNPPTNDCSVFLVGICYCKHINGPIECARFSPWWMLTQWNGGYSRTRVVRNGRPVYKHSFNWEIYWDGEVWVFFDPNGKLETTSEIYGGINIYPDSWRDWIYIRNNKYVYIRNLTICCTNSTHPTRMPTPSPDTTNPSTSPTRVPTVIPTVPPTVTPTKVPTVSPTDPPTVTPTVMPTLMPSDPPTIVPTMPPTVVPTRAPTVQPTVMPTVQPTDVPTPPPTTTLPTPPPTVPPTMAPTDDCEHFCVGDCACLDLSILDMAIVIDGSTSISTEDWEIVIESLCDAIALRFPNQTAQLGVLQFASETKVEAPMRYATNFEHAQTFHQITQLTGGTNSEDALRVAYTEFFAASVGEERNGWIEPRERFLLFITDGVPGLKQDPCQAIQDLYIPYGVKVLPVGVGVEIAASAYLLNCMATGGFDAIFYDSWTKNLASNILKGAFKDCNYGTYVTPYNGWYSRTGEMHMGKPVYCYVKKNFLVKWDGEIWSFCDMNNVIYPMAEIIGSNRNFPVTLWNWTAITDEEEYIVYNLVHICCKAFPSPTYYPTVQPTHEPTPPPQSSKPTDTPTVPPTVVPTVLPTPSPTPSPTDPPTVMPTVVPTYYPTDPPTVVPTFYPSNPPTVQPTKPPTVMPTVMPTRMPTVMPTVTPTRVPTVRPTPPPHTAEPTPSPTPYPTPPPTTSMPTVPPTTSMPTTPPTDSPSPSPTDSPTDTPSPPPTVIPTDIPSLPPTKTPTVSPTDPPTVMPTVVPTTQPSPPPTTSLPTVVPTKPPTNDCECFHFGCPCQLRYRDDADVMLIVDSSTSIADVTFEEFCTRLARAVETEFPTADGSKLGYVQFSTFPKTIFQLTHTDRDVLSDMIKDGGRIYGATYIEMAMRRGIKLWGLNDTVTNTPLVNRSRAQVTYIVTDGIPSGQEDPCDVIDEYEALGIQLVLIGIGAGARITPDGQAAVHERYQCFVDAGYQTFGFPSFDADAIVETIFAKTNVCTPEEKIMSTPYDQPYCRHAQMNNGKPVYRSGDNLEIKWRGGATDGYWELKDPHYGKGRMISRSPPVDPQIYPSTCQNWTYLDFMRRSRVSLTLHGLEGNIHNFTCVPIKCKLTRVPTRAPSYHPTVPPTPSPTPSPTPPPQTRFPTRPPSPKPTPTPSTSSPTPPPTTTSPTDIPTFPPTVPPTMIPTVPPSTRQPSYEPTIVPTVPPTLVPTGTPSLPPSSVEPSPYPTTTFPSVSPTLPPTVNPTVMPTIVPTPPPSTTLPSVSPSKPPTHLPTVHPTNCPYQLSKCNETCYEWIENIEETCRWQGRVVCAGGGVTNCDSCYQQEIEDLRRQVNLLSVSVSSYSYCSDLQAQTIQSANAVEKDMENLIVALTTEDTAKWQTVFDTFRNTGMSCSFLPTQYCELIETSAGSNTQACELVNGACQAV